jgi:hypothetical protein
MTLVRTSCPPIIVCLFCLYIRSLLTPVRTSGMPRFTITRLQISSIPPLLLPLEEEEEACRSGSNDRNSSPRRIRGFIASFPFQERSERTREGTQNVLCVDVKKDRDYIYIYVYTYKQFCVDMYIYRYVCSFVLMWLFPCLCVCHVSVSLSVFDPGHSFGTRHYILNKKEREGDVHYLLIKKRGGKDTSLSLLKKR